MRQNWKLIVKKVVSYVIGLSLLLAAIIPAQSVLAAPGKQSGTTDFVLVVDCSSSLTRTDPKKLTFQAAKKFVDMLPVNDTRLAVIAFGEDYGSSAYKINKNDKISENRVKLVCDLQDISGNRKASVHKAIDKDIKPKGDYSPLGYAYEVACKILQKGNAEDGSAAIILLSDGQVEGQDDIYNRYDFDSIDAANSIAASSSWPVYCMELNYANETGKTEFGKIAYHQMRENIPSKTGTVPIELKSAEQAAEEFEKIFAAMYPESEVDRQSGKIKNGKKEFTVSVSEMTAEQNITLTGEVPKFERIELVSPSGDKTVIKSDSNTSDEDIRTNFEDGYVSIKILTPEDGDWKVTVFGTDNVSIDLLSVGFKKTNLELSADVQEGEVKTGTKVKFTARYVYNGYAYKSDNFYREHPAKLTINGKETIDMVADKDRYEVTYTFVDKGTFTVMATVEDEVFKNGRKDSNSLSYTIDNEAPRAVDAIPDQTAGIYKEIEPIDLSKYFEDDDALHYEVKYDKSVDITHLVKGDTLSIKGGSKKGNYEITVSADDHSEEEPAVQSFILTVKNEPLELLRDSNETIELTYDKENEKSTRIVWTDYFEDPDGIPPRVAVIEDSNSGIEWIEDDNQEGMTIHADAAGEAVIEVVAIDYSDLTESQTVTFRVVSDGGWQKVVHKHKIPVGIGSAILLTALVMLLYGYTGRKIYGTWDIENVQEIAPGKTRSGKRASCRLNHLLEDVPDLYEHGDFGGVTLKAGTKFSKAVYFTNLDDIEEIEIDDNPLDKSKKIKKIPIKAGHSIRLRSIDGKDLYMYRSR